MTATADIRNIALAGHGGSGKTTLAEAMVYDASDMTRLGKVEEGNTVMDFNEDEIARKFTISSSFYPIAWNNKTISLVDTPGVSDFLSEARAMLHGVDAAALVIAADTGPQVNTGRLNAYAVEQGLARMVFITKLGREGTNFVKALEEIGKMVGKMVPLTIPIGSEGNLSGVIDLMNMKAHTYPGDGRKPEVGDIPAALKDTAAEWHNKMVESIAETDEALIEKFLEDAEISPDELKSALRAAVARGETVPVCCGSGARNIGVDIFMNTITDIMPSPLDMPPRKGTNGGGGEVTIACKDGEPVAALVLKTRIDQFTGRMNTVRVFSGVIKPDMNLFNSSTGKKERIGQMSILKGKDQIPVKELHAGEIGTLIKLESARTGDTLSAESLKVTLPPPPFPQPIFWQAVKPKSRADETKVSEAMQRMMDEDSAFHYEQNAETKELLISGMGQTHLLVALDKLKNKFGVQVDTSIPKVPYKETIKSESKVEGKHKKQTGGAGQFGVAWIHFEPRDPNDPDPLEFVDAIVGGAIPRQFIPAVEKGLRQYLVHGVIAGYPLTGLRATLFDGKHHPVDSKEIAFIQAARKALKEGIAKANPILVEPIYNLTVYVPEEHMGDIMGDLSSKRGRIHGTDNIGNLSVIKARVPLAEVQNYVADLNSITAGKGTFEMVFDHYEEVPFEIAQKIIEARKKEMVEEEED